MCYLTLKIYNFLASDGTCTVSTKTARYTELSLIVGQIILL